MNLLLAATLATLLPLNDLGPAAYDYGYNGGLWENGSNVMAADHAADGLKRAAMVRPIDGRIGFIVVGSEEPSRIAEAMFAMAHNINPAVTLVNAAAPNLDASHWTMANDPNYDRIKHAVLAPAGLTEQQVQAAWIELVDDYPYSPLPIQDGDAYRLKGAIANALRAMKKRWPNLQVAYLSSRVYGGYGTSMWNPEPYAYESGLSVRWIVVAQSVLMRTGSFWDTRIGDLDYERGITPWVAWGPYLWANGTTARSDGLTWTPQDFEPNGETLSDEGARKAATMLYELLLREPTAAWFRAAPTPRKRAASSE